MRGSRVAVLAAIAIVAASPVRAQQAKPAVIVGRVTDEKTLEPLSDVVITLSTGPEARTGSNGRYSIASPRSGRIVLRFRRIGYEPGAVPVEALEGETTTFDIAMAKSATTPAVAEADPSTDTAKTKLDTVTVKAVAPSTVSPRLEEFESRRMKWVNGTFITQADIKKRIPSRLTDMFRGIPSVKLMDSAGTTLVALARAPKPDLAGGSMGRGGLGGRSSSPKFITDCFLRVGVDGFIREWGFDMNSIAPEEVHGIEVFPGAASIPAKYSGARSDMMCGLVMIWTRSQ